MAEAFLVQKSLGGGTDISDAVVELDFTNVTYDGSEHQPKVQSVTYKGKALTEYQDYVSYSAAYTSAGSYAVIISGIGDYSGAKEAAWTIEQAQGSISVSPSSVSISGAIGTTTTAKLTITGDGEVTFGASDYASLSREGTTLTVKSVAAGSGTVDIVLEDGVNYKGARCTLNVSVSTVDPVFANNSWETIAECCMKGEVPETWQVGDLSPVVKIFNKDIRFRIVDKNHFDLAKTDKYYGNNNYNKGTNKAALVLHANEIFDRDSLMESGSSNTYKWEDCYFRTKYIPKYIDTSTYSDSQFLSFVRKVITKTAYTPSTYAIVENEDKFFLLSEYEVFGKNIHTADVSGGDGTDYKEGKQLKYYIANSRIKFYYSDGEAWDWWLRSPYNRNSSLGIQVEETGESGGRTLTNNGGGVAIACCI